MEYRTLGRTGIKVSALGFGCGAGAGLLIRGDVFDQRSAVERALEGGITYFDTAANYGKGQSEINLGRVLRELHADAVVGTKVSVRPDEVDHATPLLQERLREGLRRLGRESVDVCTFHGRIGNGFEHNARDVSGSIAEAMRSLVDIGLCRAIGFSGMGDAESIVELITTKAFDYCQCQFRISNPSAAFQPGQIPVLADYGDVLASARATETGVMAIRALAAGTLSDAPEPHPNSQRFPDEHEPDADREEAVANAIRPIVGDFGLTSLSELAIAFCVSNLDLATVVIGFSDEQQVTSALHATQHAPLAPDLLDQLHRTTVSILRANAPTGQDR